MVPEILRWYATVDYTVELFPEALNVLLAFRGLALKLALVTYGGTLIQRNKVRLLGVEEFLDVVVYARETVIGKEKLDPEVYQVALQKLGVGAGEVVCVGDNPHREFWGAKQLGTRTVRVLCGEFEDVHLSEECKAEIALHNLAELPGGIERFNRFFGL